MILEYLEYNSIRNRLDPSKLDALWKLDAVLSIFRGILW